MLCWYFSKSDVQSCTPSRKDGIDIATETRYRREGAKLIITASTNMGLYPYFLVQLVLLAYVCIVVNYKKALTKV